MNVPIISRRRAAHKAELQELHDHIKLAALGVEARVAENEQSMTAFVTEFCKQLSESEDSDG